MQNFRFSEAEGIALFAKYERCARVTALLRENEARRLRIRQRLDVCICLAHYDERFSAAFLRQPEERGECQRASLPVPKINAHTINECRMAIQHLQQPFA